MAEGIQAKKVDVMAAIQDAFTVAVSGSVENLDQARNEMAAFLVDIEPDVDAAVIMASSGAETHVNTLKFIYNATVLRAGRVGQGVVAKEKALAAATVVAVLRGLLAVGITALV